MTKSWIWCVQCAQRKGTSDSRNNPEEHATAEMLVAVSKRNVRYTGCMCVFTVPIWCTTSNPSYSRSVCTQSVLAVMPATTVVVVVAAVIVGVRYVICIATGVCFHHITAHAPAASLDSHGNTVKSICSIPSCLCDTQNTSSLYHPCQLNSVSCRWW